ncbi:MAG: rhomboid family intramembrane serine protease, partial [Henriciella sp.]
AIVFAILFLLGSAILAQRKNRIIGHEAHLGGAVSGLVGTLMIEPRALIIFLEQMAEGLSGTQL